MNSFTKKRILYSTLAVSACLALSSANRLSAQPPWPFAPVITPMAQQNAMNLVLNQVSWFQNATRSYSYSGSGGYGLLVQQFQAVRDQFAGFKTTLSPHQLDVGATQLAELQAGLDIIREAFTDYQTAVANGQSSQSAFVNMRKVLNEAIGVWAQEFKKDCRQLRVGW